MSFTVPRKSYDSPDNETLPVVPFAGALMLSVSGAVVSTCTVFITDEVRVALSVAVIVMMYVPSTSLFVSLLDFAVLNLMLQFPPVAPLVIVNGPSTTVPSVFFTVTTTVLIPLPLSVAVPLIVKVSLLVISSLIVASELSTMPVILTDGMLVSMRIVS